LLAVFNRRIEFVKGEIGIGYPGFYNPLNQAAIGIPVKKADIEPLQVLQLSREQFPD